MQAEKTQTRLWIVVGLAVIVAIWVMKGCDQPPQRHRILVHIVDRSYSIEKYRARIGGWFSPIFMQMPPETNYIMIAMSRDSQIIAHYPELPSVEKMAGDGVIKSLELDSRWGTKPLDALRLALDVARKYPGSDIAVVIFSDGENEFYDDEAELSLISKELIEQKNVKAIGIFGVKDSLRPVWEDRFGISNQEKVIVRGVSDTEDNIPILIEKAIY